MTNHGIVYLIGAGPGDPDLLTVKAQRLIKSADVVLYDRLVSEDILALIPKGASRISVGKIPGKRCVSQDEINRQLVAAAKSGRLVVRLKGGDPYLFGRGGEEALALNEQGIPFKVIPGVTAATGCSAYSGIPLTHRGLNHGVRFLTGHFSDNQALDIDWQKVADPDCTLVIYMGLGNLQYIADNLINAGLPGSTPTAAIQNGTTKNQIKIVSTLQDIDDAVTRASLEAPVMIIVGEVVSLNEYLDWYQGASDSIEIIESDIDESTFDMAHA